MEIINTVWEKRNLGCDSVEIRCTQEDEELDAESILALKQPYQVIKIPCSKTGLLLQAQSLGFMMIECQIIYKTNIKDYHFPQKYERLLKDVSYHRATQEEIDDTLRRVRSGKIFTRDRIALDSHFSLAIAGKRYANWMQDLLDKEYIMYMRTYRGNAFGWIIMKVLEDGTGDLVLEADFQEKSWCGMGISGAYLNIKIAKDEGAKRIIGAVSTNNLRNVKINVEIGSNINRIDYVLVKHVNSPF